MVIRTVAHMRKTPGEPKLGFDNQLARGINTMVRKEDLKSPHMHPQQLADHRDAICSRLDILGHHYADCKPAAGLAPIFVGRRKCFADKAAGASFRAIVLDY